MFSPFKKFENYIYEFKKILKIITDVANCVTHKHVKLQFETPYIMSYTQKNLIKLRDLKICIFRSTPCHFCVVQNIKYLKLILCTFVGYTIGYTRLSSDFFEIDKYEFRISFNWRERWSSEPKVSTQKEIID